ncbi:hypothetical protein FJZ31_30480 [Candidatus Poribacteria bacterium]|nr:hypothetical protein [Candidatus Poribacteria bacterium]
MPKRKTLPQFNSYEQAAEWLDSHSTADLENTKFHFEVASPLVMQIFDSLSEIEEAIVVEKKLSQQIRQIAQQQGLTTQALVYKWFQEKVEESLQSSK